MLQICCKLKKKWQWHYNIWTWRHRQFFLTLFCLSCQVQLLVHVSCQYHHWFWSYANFFFKGLTSNSHIGNTPAWVSPNINIWRLGRVRNTKFSINSSNKMLLDAAKYQGHRFTVLELGLILFIWWSADKMKNLRFLIMSCHFTISKCFLLF